MLKMPHRKWWIFLISASAASLFIFTSISKSDEINADSISTLRQPATRHPKPTHSACPSSPTLQLLDNFDPLADLLPCKRIVYNRAPKCGSRTVLSTLKVVASKNNFTVYDREKPANNKPFLTDHGQLRAFAEEFNALEEPFLYAQHIHYLNFSLFQMVSPMYINVIRDPLEGLVSHYFFNAFGSSNAPLASPKPPYDISLDECVKKRLGSCMNIHHIIPFFCGHEKSCRSDTAASLAKAKRAVRESYLVVGLTEDLPAFMEVLQTLMPHFFANLTNVFAQQELLLHQRYKTVKKFEVKEEIRRILRKHLVLEYDFYNFVQARFYNTLSKVRSAFKMD